MQSSEGSIIKGELRSRVGNNATLDDTQVVNKGCVPCYRREVCDQRKKEKQQPRQEPQLNRGEHMADRLPPCREPVAAPRNHVDSDSDGESIISIQSGRLKNGSRGTPSVISVKSEATPHT